MMEVSITLQAIDRLSAPLRAMLRSVERLAEVTARVSRAVSRSMMNMYDRTRDAGYHFRKLAGEEGMARAARSAEYLKGKLKGLTGGLSLLKYASAAAIVGLGEEFVRGVFKAGGEMQRMEVSLTRIEGGAARAHKAMAWLSNFAMGPGANFSMPDLMRAYTQAKSYKMNPMGGSLAAFADFAALHNRSIYAVMYAVKDAMEGTSMRPLANMGIKIKQGRGQDGVNTYLVPRPGGEDGFETVTGARNPLAVLAMVMRIMNAQARGLAVAQAGTVPGGIQQLKQRLYMFEAQVAQSGVLEWARKRINELLAWIDQASRSGSLTRLAKTISDFITGAGDKIIAFFKGTNWSAVAKDLSALAASIGAVAAVIKPLVDLAGGGLSGLFNLYIVTQIVGMTGALMGLAPVLAATITMLTGFDIAAAPITVIILALGALIAVGYLLWANWDKVTGWLQGAWEKLKGWWNGMPGWLQAIVVVVGVIFAPWIALPALIIAKWDTLKGYFTGLFGYLSHLHPPDWMRGALGVIPGGALIGSDTLPQDAPRFGAPKLGPPRLALGSGKAIEGVSGIASESRSRLDIHLHGAPAGTRTRTQAAPRQTINVNRGPIQVGD